VTNQRTPGSLCFVSCSKKLAFYFRFKNLDVFQFLVCQAAFGSKILEIFKWHLTRELCWVPSCRFFGPWTEVRTDDDRKTIAFGQKTQLWPDPGPKMGSPIPKWGVPHVVYALFCIHFSPVPKNGQIKPVVSYRLSPENRTDPNGEDRFHWILLFGNSLICAFYSFHRSAVRFPPFPVVLSSPHYPQHRFFGQQRKVGRSRR
jgi:hypothetical protein